MPQTANPLSGLGSATVDTAARVSRISMDSAERTITLQLEFAKGAIAEATRSVRALSGTTDMQQLLALRTRMAEKALENFMGYSRSLYEVASEAQAELSKLAEERMSAFQQVMAESVDQAARSVPAGGDVAAAAIKSSLAAATSAYDSFTKAARHATSLADASVRGGATAKTRK